MSIEIRPYHHQDLHAIVQVMNHYIEHDAGLYTEVLLTEELASHWISERHRESVPFLVAQDGPALLGLAYARPFRSQTGSAHVWESSVYLDVTAAASRSGIGTLLMQQLLGNLKRSGVTEVMAMIDSGNKVSSAFHEKLGFVQLCKIPRAGRKLGHFRDALLFQRSQ
ncbi:MAG: N-acetyltransferase family protein [Flavobacteriales bacterium]